MQKIMRVAITAIFVFILLVASFSPAHSQERVRIAWAGASPANSPIWVVQEKGFLKKQGLDAEVISITASPIALQAMLAGEVDVIVTSVTTLVNSRLAGADTVMILGMVPTFVDHIITLPSITRVEELKGKTGGVNRIGSTSDLGLRLALRRLGIDPEKDTRIVTAGGNPERFAALSKGVVQFTIMPEPFVREAEKLGFRDFLDIGSLKIPFWWNGVLTREAIIKSKRPVVAKFARAMTEALHFLKTEKEASKAIFSKNLRLTDPEGLERAYKAYSGVFPQAPYPTSDGVKTLLDDMAPRNPKAAAADPKTFVDMSFVQELEAAGFIKQLYKK
ncbi:MAG: ABC transporter substrate-binding protein [Deltaproteobacteria bacterium]|nr:ABC transporter substrate-binding protein [Deltaproteobacteria bacterium]